MDIRRRILELVEKGVECEYLDFKAKMYPRKGTLDLLKDILAMANSSYENSKYIILGVKDDTLKGRYIVGVDHEEKVDVSSYQQYILNNIEPDINFDLHYIEIEEKIIAVIEIRNTNNKPYMTKKKVNNLEEGYCIVRKGSINTLARRSDFDMFYQSKEKFEIIILDSYLRAVEDKIGTAFLDVSLRNLTKMPITIMGGKLLVKDRNVLLSQHSLVGLGREEGADFRLEIPPFSEKTGDLYLSFNSSDCIRIGLDEYGLTNKSFIFELVLYDTLQNQYYAQIENGSVYAKGELLWKVKLKKERDSHK
ncbi:AlbA family DNA-binding domain-containing protein [Metabacillus fastidiosus]|uniref:ATP-binding protein n=1 Tax=Metabacillus fastidiosus TaxID=1458 RepID=A0ABU6NUF6_9BACI|nr:ATP-binding protein [Metabacillus fastidiosus]MED4400338.1 ATP-binding protein [Metabacillus fastidiosus]